MTECRVIGWGREQGRGFGGICGFLASDIVINMINPARRKLLGMQ